MRVIEQFQVSLITNIRNDSYLAKEIQYISFIPIQNAPLPHILIGGFETKFSYLHERVVCEINFYINLYSRGLDSKNLQEIHQKLNESLATNHLAMRDFKAVTIKELRSIMDSGQDLTTTKLQMFYSSIVR
jgi:hypothetical protein